MMISREMGASENLLQLLIGNLSILCLIWAVLQIFQLFIDVEAFRVLQ